MKILFLNQYFPPEVEPSASKVYDLGKRLVGRGHSVTVLTGMPNYPTGRLDPHYRRRLRSTEKVEGMQVLRTAVIPSSNRASLRRVCNHLSFLASGLVRSFSVHEIDIVLATSPPLENGLLGALVSRRMGRSFIFEVRDPWPEVAVELGILQNRWIIRLAEGMEHFIYKTAQKIVVVTQQFQKHVCARGVPEEKVAVIENGSDTELFTPYAPEGIKGQYGLQDKFVITYAGTHGIQANLQSVLEAANLLRDRDDIRFLFIGKGALKGELQQRAIAHRMTNVLFLDPMPRVQLAAFLASSDVCLVHTRRHPVFENNIPVKMYDYMACGRPLILGANGEARVLLEKAQAGVWSEPDNPSMLADTVLQLYNNSDLCRILGRNGRDYVVKHFSRDVLTDKYEALMNQITRRSS